MSASPNSSNGEVSCTAMLLYLVLMIDQAVESESRAENAGSARLSIDGFSRISTNIGTLPRLPLSD